MIASLIFAVTTVLMPILAWLIINQSWQFFVPLLSIHFKPWRLLIFVCGLPSLLCGLALLGIPESPKFVLSQGRQSDTIAILQKIYLLNGGNGKCPLGAADIIEEEESIALRLQLGNHCSTGGCRGILQTMLVQTVPLFKRDYLRITVIGSVIQFGIFGNSNGMYMWFPEILNRMNDFMEEHPMAQASMCEILSMTKRNTSGTTSLADAMIAQVDDVKMVSEQW